jgi:hypothetical protein
MQVHGSLFTMRTIRLLLTAAGIAAAPILASAQTLYRCGNVYSQTPCAPDAATVKARPNAVADAAPGLQGAELCSATVARELQLDETGPVQIASVTKAPAEVIQYADKPTATRKYIVTLKVKPTAAFDGPRGYTCHLSEDERRVLRFSAR